MDAAERDDMIRAPKNRFEKNMGRHIAFDWNAVQAKLEANVEKHVFVYHNGAESYYAARGFRGLIKV
ncbi:MAG: DUF4256 domain-containing protein [Methylophilus sp.]